MTLAAGTDVRSSVDETSLVLTVAEVVPLTQGVRHVRFADAAGRTLPSFTPGSHLVLSCGTGVDGRPRRNAYSLTGPEFEPDHYSISVRLDEHGRGGSRWVHELGVGQVVRAGMPRSAFAPVLTARHHVLVAGGIGVTPILSHVRAARKWGRSFEVHYIFREGDGPHLEDLRELCRDRLHIYNTPESFWAHMEPALLDQPLGTHLYVCGPPGLIDALTGRARQDGWPDARVHYEHFGVGDLDPGNPFTAHLGRTGVDVTVDSGVSLLEALESEGLAVPSLCRQGVCGECRLPVRGGGVDHRDMYLSEAEKAVGDCMMPCVSRARGERLELDL